MSATSGDFVVRKIKDGPDPASIDLSRLLNEWMEKSGPDGLFRTCSNCRHMRQDGAAFCGLYNTTPPVFVIMRGCDDHKDVTDLPF